MENQQIANDVTKTSAKKISCDGGGGALGHPAIYLAIGDSGKIDCPYCGKKFIYENDAKNG